MGRSAKESKSLVIEIVFIPSSILSTARHEKSRRNLDTARYKDYFEYEAITLFGLPSQVVLL